jgi:uncharacterized protein with ParB-like and HNH nuclease domain
MHASETTIRKLIEGSKQYVIPLFQRPYSWKQKHWLTLWQDVVDLVDAPKARPHFFGSTVTAPARSIPQGVGKWLLIDGQQRLTTTQLFLAAIRDSAIDVQAESLNANGEKLTAADLIRNFLLMRIHVNE